MRITYLFAMLFLSTIFTIMNYAQQAYAPRAELRDSVPEGMRNSYDIMKRNTPDKSLIELPAYPGAEIIETSRSTQSVDDSNNPDLPTVTLISDDPAEKIIEVYKDIIEDYPQWHRDDNLRIFYKGDLQESLNQHSPYIQVTEITSGEPDLIYVSSDILEVANSKIVVCYNPYKGKK